MFFIPELHTASLTPASLCSFKSRSKIRRFDTIPPMLGKLVTHAQLIKGPSLRARADSTYAHAFQNQTKGLGEWFSNHTLYQNPLESLLKYRLLGPLPEFSDAVSLELGLGICFSNKRPVDLVAAGLRAHFENNYLISKEASFHHQGRQNWRNFFPKLYFEIFSDVPGPKGFSETKVV